MKILQKHSRLFFLSACIFLLVFFWFNAKRGLDPDFGWHLRMGQVIATSGVPQTDPFSYTMSYYPFVDHEWLTNRGIASLYPIIGLSGLTFIAILVAFGALFLQTIFLSKQWILLPFLLVGSGVVGYLGIRPQVFSWFFVSLLLVIFLHDRLWRIFRWGIPLLMLLWVNMHGSFALCVMLVGLVVLTKQIQKRKVLVGDLVVFCLTLGATFVNPYGWRSWWEVWMQMSDSGLRWSIQEWMPAFFMLNMSFMVFLPLSVLLMWRYRKKFSLLEWVLYLVLLLMGLSSARHLPFWLLVSLSMTTKAMEFFAAEVQKDAFGRKSFPIAYEFLFGVVLLIVTSGFIIAVFVHPPTQTAEYPNRAIQFLKTHKTPGNVIAQYEMGGYLIWQYPEKKVFIDGRMPSWRATTAPAGQSANAFAEYSEFFGKRASVKPILRKYHIDTVIISRHEEPPLVVKMSRFLRKFNILFPDTEELRKELIRQHMHVVYQDEAMVIYRSI